MAVARTVESPEPKRKSGDGEQHREDDEGSRDRKAPTAGERGVYPRVLTANSRHSPGTPFNT
jgi:hypothetical protein